MSINNFSNVIHLGPEYRNHRGGIGAVIASYAENIENFKFIPTYNGRYHKIGNYSLAIFSFFKLFITLSFNSNIKAIHLHSAAYGSFYRKFLFYLLAKKICKRKAIFHLHAGAFGFFYNDSSKLGKYVIKCLIEDADVVICLSESWRDFLSNNFNISKLYILNNPVEKCKVNSVLDFESKIHLLFLGVIADRKGIFDLLNVVAENKIEWCDRFLLTVGGFGEEDRLKRFISDNELSNLVNYVGWVDGERKKELLSNCDVLILPSYFEGLPVSILEAMANGKAIISSNVGGISEVVNNDYNGFLIEPGDKSEIYRVINAFITNPDLIRSMGVNSLKIIKPFFVDDVLIELNKIYKSSFIY